MNANLPAVRAVLAEVISRGIVVMSLRNMLILLGKWQDRPSAWADLLDVWEELEQARDTLFGFTVDGDVLVLCREPSNAGALVKVAEWETKADKPLFA